MQLNDEVQHEEEQQPHGHVEWTLVEPEMGVSGETDIGDENEPERIEERTVEPEQIQR